MSFPEKAVVFFKVSEKKENTKFASGFKMQNQAGSTGQEAANAQNLTPGRDSVGHQEMTPLSKALIVAGNEIPSRSPPREIPPPKGVITFSNTFKNRDQ